MKNFKSIYAVIIIMSTINGFAQGFDPIDPNGDPGQGTPIDTGTTILLLFATLIIAFFVIKQKSKRKNIM